MAESITGAQEIFSSSSTGVGSWFQIPPKLGNLTLQSLTSGSSVGALVSSVMDFEVSNGPADSPVPLATVLGTVTLSSAASPGSDGLAINANWKYVRGKLTSISTSTGAKARAIAFGQVRS